MIDYFIKTGLNISEKFEEILKFIDNIRVQQKTLQWVMNIVDYIWKVTQIILKETRKYFYITIDKK